MLEENQINKSSRRVVGELELSWPHQTLTQYVTDRIKEMPRDPRDWYKLSGINAVILASSERPVIPKSRERFIQQFALGAAACGLAYLMVRSSVNHKPNVMEDRE